MSKKIPHDIIISQSHVSNSSFVPDNNSECFAFVHDSVRIKVMAEIGQPYRLYQYRIIRVLHGTAVYSINLIDYQFKRNDIVIIPAKSIIEVKEYSEDFAVEVIIVKSLPTESIVKMDLLPQKVTLVKPSQIAEQRIEYYFELTKLLMASSEHSDITLAYLIFAICEDMACEYKAQFKSHSEKEYNNVINNFIEILNQFGTKERNVSFYSDKLNITPNYLNATVKRLTGMTVMNWVNKATVMEAKVLLGNSSMKIQDIAKLLNFPESTVFVRYFRHHTGQTPLTYRRNVIK